jgi:hypothetical protein
LKESIEFLKENLTNLFDAHTYLEIRYEFRESINTHIVEVKPIHCFKSDKQYILKKIEIEEIFEDKFYAEEIVFISDDNLVKIENPIFSLGVSNDENKAKIHFVQCKIEFLLPSIGIQPYTVSNPKINLLAQPPGEYIAQATENIPQDSALISESSFFN